MVQFCERLFWTGHYRRSKFHISALLYLSYLHWKYMQWNYSEDTSKNCKTELQFFYCNMDKYFAIHSTMKKCRFKFTVITLHLEQQSNVENTVKNCKLDYSYSTVLCTFLSCVPYLQCLYRQAILNKSQKMQNKVWNFDLPSNHYVFWRTVLTKKLPWTI
jgi:hypothetical protein